RRDVGYREPGDAQVAWPGVGRGPADCLGGLEGVGWYDDREVGDGPQPGQVLDRVMRRAQLAVGQARALPAQDDACLAIGHVRLDLLERPAGEEWRGGDAHEILLGDPDIDHPVRELSLELGQIA